MCVFVHLVFLRLGTFSSHITIVAGTLVPMGDMFSGVH